MDSKDIQTNGWMTIKVVGSGRHFKGYMNNKLLVHGHAPPLDSGMVGLHLNGAGPLGLKVLKMQIIKEGK